MFVLVLLFIMCTSLTATGYIPVVVQESGAEDVEKYATVIHFYLDLINNGNKNVEVTVTPQQCCLIIEKGDTDCEVIELRPPVILALGPRVDQFAWNNTGRALFKFRNLYSRYRKGHCLFEITEGKDVNFQYTLNFDTAPRDNNNQACTGIDQDQDRNCVQVDCAIKYKGRRNFYRRETGKCEPVVECDTRGKDEAEIIAYYDWNSNVCHQLYMDENTFSQAESDTEIPAQIDPSQSVYYPNLEPQYLKSMNDKKEKMNCNNGVQNGIYCDCDEGWMSSGIHEKDPLTFHWCDTETVDQRRISGQPVKLAKPMEIFCIIILSFANISLISFWFYLGYILFLKERCQQACGKQQKPSYTLLKSF